MAKKKLFVLIFLCGCLSCKQQSHQVEITQKPYFDLVQYFHEQSRYLQNKNQPIQKEVSKNNQQEIKKMHIDSWENEFGLFISSDINKADWLSSYSIDSTALLLSYKRKDAKLRTKRIDVYKENDGSIKQIHIVNTDQNWLYSSTESLDYFPDSIYRIDKKQSIRIIGENQYTIEGIFNK